MSSGSAGCSGWVVTRATGFVECVESTAARHSWLRSALAAPCTGNHPPGELVLPQSGHACPHVATGFVRRAESKVHRWGMAQKSGGRWASSQISASGHLAGDLAWHLAGHLAGAICHVEWHSAALVVLPGSARGSLRVVTRGVGAGVASANNRRPLLGAPRWHASSRQRGGSVAASMCQQWCTRAVVGLQVGWGAGTHVVHAATWYSKVAG